MPSYGLFMQWSLCLCDKLYEEFMLGPAAACLLSVDLQMTLLLAPTCLDTYNLIFHTRILGMTALSMRGPSAPVCVCAQLCVFDVIHSVGPELGQVNMARAACCEIDQTIDKT